MITSFKLCATVPITPSIELRIRNCLDNTPVTEAHVTVTHLGADGPSVVVDNEQVDGAGILLSDVPTTGNYHIQVTAEGFIESDFEMEVKCTTATDCENIKVVTLSTHLEPGETRIMVNWDEKPSCLGKYQANMKH